MENINSNTRYNSNIKSNDSFEVMSDGRTGKTDKRKECRWKTNTVKQKQYNIISQSKITLLIRKRV